MNANALPPDPRVSYSTSDLVFHNLCLRIAEFLSEEISFANEINYVSGRHSDAYDFSCSYEFTEPLSSDQVATMKTVFRHYGLETGNAAFIRGGRALELGLVVVGTGYGETTTRCGTTAVA